jgi:hypothetical protein
MAYYDQYHPYYEQVATPLTLPLEAKAPSGSVQKRMIFILACVTLVIVPLFVSLRPSQAAEADRATDSVPNVAGEGEQESPEIGLSGPSVPGALAPVFTPEVLFWGPQIDAWARRYGLDPNLVAIIMQIESCGDPGAISVAGAQGLFQVMPFHFAAGENSLDPETNAHRGLNYFVERLSQTNGDVGRAFAGYNGGHVAAAASWDQWLPETQRYYVWSTGIYEDILAGEAQSETLQQWLQAGGASLCRQAASRLGL